MRIDEAFAACEETVRRHDPDRYFSALFAPAARRPLLFALYAFNHEIARVGESVREPMMAAIRLQWWREAAESARSGAPRAHAVVEALVPLFAEADVPPTMVEALVDSREADAGEESFADLAALEAYADASSGGVMRMAARVLGAGDRLDDLARAAGVAFALTGLLRAVPFHAARGKLYLPKDLLAGESLTPQEVFAGRGGARLRRVMDVVAARARLHLAAARSHGRPGAGLAAVLPAATVPAYLKLITRPGFDPFTMPAELPLYRRQLSLLGASLRGRI